MSSRILLALMGLLLAKSAFAQSKVPREFMPFNCVEITHGLEYRILKGEQEPVRETVTLEKWRNQTLVSSSKYQITSAHYEGDMIVVVEGVELNPALHTDTPGLRLKLATTTGQNQSTLELPEPGTFSCQTP